MSNEPSLLQRTRCCGGATTEIGSSWRKPSRRTVSSTPPEPSSRPCARTAIRRASSTGTSRIPHLLESEHAGEPGRRPLEPRADVPTHARLRMEAPDMEHALGPVGLEVGAADDAVAGEQGQDVVAV